jgi:NADH dehydrogenase FAD-containing subunit
MAKGHIAIVGGGFAGLSAAHAIGDRAKVTLIDRTGAFEFLPNIHEIVSGRQTPKSVRLPRARILDDLGQHFVAAEVSSVDADARVVHTSGGPVGYDALLLACGAEPITDAVPGVDDHAICFRSAAAAEAVRRRVKELVQAKTLARVVIVGGGFTGVEVLGEILRKYRDQKKLALTIVESGPRLLGGWAKVLGKRVKKLAEREGVDVVTEARVKCVEAGAVVLEDGRRISSALTIWATGSRAPAFVRESGWLGEHGRGLRVNAGLDLSTRPGIFVAGDVAAPPQHPKKQAAQALELGKRAGKNVVRFLDGRPLKDFEKQSIPVLLTFGDLSAFLVLDDDTVIEGAALGVGRELTFQAGMADLDQLASRGGFDRLGRRFRHARTLEAFTADPLSLAVGLTRLRVHAA